MPWAAQVKLSAWPCQSLMSLKCISREQLLQNQKKNPTTCNKKYRFLHHECYCVVRLTYSCWGTDCSSKMIFFFNWHLSLFSAYSQQCWKTKANIKWCFYLYVRSAIIFTELLSWGPIYSSWILCALSLHH